MTCQIWEMELKALRFPIRIGLEFKKVIYNKVSLLKHYPQEKEQNLDLFVEEQVQKAIEDQ